MLDCRSNNRASVFQPECSFKAGEKSFWGRLYGSAKALAISQLVSETEAPVIIMTADSLSASRLTEELRFYLNDREINNLLSFPDWGNITLRFDFTLSGYYLGKIGNADQLANLKKRHSDCAGDDTDASSDA